MLPRSSGILKILALLAALGPVLPAAALAAVAADRALDPRPNIIVLLTDDQGYDDFGFTGNPRVSTPRLDQLARESVRYTQFQVAPLCAPTRASLLTGRDYLRTGVWGVHGGQDFMLPDETTFAENLRRAGYATSMFGKWHNGHGYAFGPWNRGFDEGIDAELYKHARGIHHNHLGETKTLPPGRWETDELTDAAIAVIEKNRASPFCLYLSYPAPHSPWEAPQDRIDHFIARGDPPDLALLYAMLEQVDTSVGRVLDTLDRLAIAEHTAVFFLSDNGAIHSVTDHRSLSDEDWRRRNPSGLRANKATVYEGGIRSPLLARWPGRWIPRIESRPASVIDLHPTFLELAQTSPRPDALPFDGVSLAPSLADATLSPPARTLFAARDTPVLSGPENAGKDQRYTGAIVGADLRYEDQVLAARQGDLKLVKNGAYLELFELSADPRESQNIAAARPAEVASLEAALRTWYEGILATGRAYHMPRFPVGVPGDKRPMISACAPAARRGGVAYASHTAKNWRAPGDGADYLLEVVRPGRYRVVVSGFSVSPGIRLSATCGAARTEGELRQSGETSLGELDLPAGPATLAIDCIAPGETSAAMELRAIHLVPL